jgi:hypothetical protein
MIKIPNNGKWVQTNRSDIQGNLWSTWNADLQTNKGALRVSPRARLNTATQGCPVAAAQWSVPWVMAGTTIYKGGASPNVAFAADTSTSASTDYTSEGDLQYFAGVLLATAPTRLRKLSDFSGGTWSDVDTITSGFSHKMCHFIKFDRLYYIQSSLINSLDTSLAIADTGDYTLTLREVDAYSMAATDTNVWIVGTSIRDSGGEHTQRAAILQWDGISADVTREYTLPNAYAAIAITIDKERNIPIVMSSSGILYEFNGSGFSEIGRLPFKKHLPFNLNVTTNTRLVHPNGMYYTDRGTVRCLVNNLNGDNSATFEENFPAGVWEWSREHGFVHIQPLSPYAGSVTDYGQNRLSQVGMLIDMNLYSTTAGRDGTYLAGATYFTDASSTASGIFYDNSLDTIQKNGYFVTTKIFSPNILEAWEKVALRFKRLLDSTDKIVLKYRTTEADPTYATITWTSTTTFTTTTNVSAYYDSTLGRGYEVEVLQGKGSGKCAHITAISENGGTYTVTVDETFTGATSGTAKARFQKWIKIDSIDSLTKDYVDIGLNLKTVWVQFKVFMQHTGGDEVYDLVLTHSKTL